MLPVEWHSCTRSPPECLQVHECVVCDKVFRTARALQRHTGSATHARQLVALKLQLHAEESLAIDG